MAEDAAGKFKLHTSENAGSAFSRPFWRYTLPGHGVMRWHEAFEMPKDAHYSGCVSIELEDYRFSDRQDIEQVDLVTSRRFLQTC